MIFGFFLCSVPVEVAALAAGRFWRTTAFAPAALVPPSVAVTTLVLKVAAAAAAAAAAAPPSAAHVFGSLLLAVL